MRLRVSPLCMFMWRNGQMVCDDPLEHRQVALSANAQRLILHFADWRDADDAADPGGELDPQLVRQLHEARVLIAEGSAEHQLAQSLGPWEQWGTAAMYFHLASRTTGADDFRSAAEDTAWLLDHQPDRPQPPEVKEYTDAERLPLPPCGNAPLAAMGLDAVLRRRRTTRSFDAGQPVTEAQLATLLHWVAGVQHRVESKVFRTSLLRASPSGGARQPIEVYPVVLNVTGVSAGVYHYHPTAHALEALDAGPLDAEQLIDMCGGQTYLRTAGVVLLYTASLDRVAWKYLQGRTYRTLFMELGHFSQTAYLTGAALGLGVVFTAAIRDTAVEALLGLDWRHEIPCGVTVVGVPAPAEAARQDAMLHGGPASFSFVGDTWDGLG
jgi:SagB-type dehydrogenase family enzyme